MSDINKRTIPDGLECSNENLDEGIHQWLHHLKLVSMFTDILNICNCVILFQLLKCMNWMWRFSH